MKTMRCRCGDPISQEAYDEAVELKADYARCAVCLNIWKESYVRSQTLTRTPITVEAVEKCAFEGLSPAESAKMIGVAKGTFKNAIYSRPKISAAWKKGKERRANLGVSK